MNRKLLAMDLDGTAVADDYSMSSSSIEAIAKAQKAGHVIAFVSGRRDVDMLTLGEEQWSVDYHILNNGGKIIRCKDRKIIFNQIIDVKTCEKIIKHCLKNDLQLQFYRGMEWYVTKINSRTMDYARMLGVTPVLKDRFEDIDLEGIEGFMATVDCDPVGRYIDEQLPELCYSNSEPGTIDIMRNDVSKSNGIKVLADMLGIAAKDTIAVGNYYNDIDMLEKAGTGIAVANSLDEVKEAADYVTINDNNHDAVAEIVDLIMKGKFD